MVAMKKMMAACLLGLGLFAAGCNDSGGGSLGPAPTSDELTGKWYFRKETTKGTFTMKLPPLIDTSGNINESETYSGTTYYIDFKADHTYQSNRPDSDIPDFEFGGLEKRVPAKRAEMDEGTWSLDGKVLTLVTDPYEGEPVGDTLKLTVGLNGGTLTAVLKTDISQREGDYVMENKTTSTFELEK